jgi:hypothetical protein
VTRSMISSRKGANLMQPQLNSKRGQEFLSVFMNYITEVDKPTAKSNLEGGWRYCLKKLKFDAPEFRVFYNSPELLHFVLPGDQRTVKWYEPIFKIDERNSSYFRPIQLPNAFLRYCSEHNLNGLISNIHRPALPKSLSQYTSINVFTNAQGVYNVVVPTIPASHNSAHSRFLKVELFLELTFIDFILR